MHDAWIGASPSYRHPQCLNGERSVESGRDSIPNHTVRTSIQYRCQIGETGSDTDVGDVSHSYLVYLTSNHPLDEVRIPGEAKVTVRGSNPLTLDLAQKVTSLNG